MSTMTLEHIKEVADNLAKAQSFDPWSAKWISAAHVLLRSLAAREADAVPFDIEAAASEFIEEGCEGQSGTAYPSKPAAWFITQFANSLPTLYVAPIAKEADLVPVAEVTEAQECSRYGGTITHRFGKLLTEVPLGAKLYASPVAQEAAYERAVIEAAMVTECVNIEGREPKDIINDVISWHVNVAQEATTPTDDILKLDPDTNECSPDPVVRKAFADGYDTGYAHGKEAAAPAEQVGDGVKMRLAVALDFADNPRPYHTMQAPADTNSELYRALAVLAAAYREAVAKPDLSGRYRAVMEAQGGVMKETREYTLRAMAGNYANGQSWDHLDAAVCLQAADEIKALRAALAAHPHTGHSAVPEAMPDDPDENNAGKGYIRGWNDCRKAMLAAAPEPPK